MAYEKAWCDFDEDVGLMLENMLKGTSKRKLEVMGDLILTFRVRFGVLEACKEHAAPTPSRCQKEIARIKREL